MNPISRTRATAAAVGLGLVISVSGTGVVQAADYPPVPTQVTCKAKAVKKKTKIKINMGPNLDSGYYTFRLDKKKKKGWVRYLKTYKTKGGKEVRTVNVKKGTWRAKCYGTSFPIAAPALDATSNKVKIRK